MEHWRWAAPTLHLAHHRCRKVFDAHQPCSVLRISQSNCLRGALDGQDTSDPRHVCQLDLWQKSKWLRRVHPEVGQTGKLVSPIIRLTVKMLYQVTNTCSDQLLTTIIPLYTSQMADSDPETLPPPSPPVVPLKERIELTYTK